MSSGDYNTAQSITGNGLLDSILVNYDALDWTVGFCRKMRGGIPRDDMEGWLLCSGYMQVLGLDVATILQDLAGNPERGVCLDAPTLEFWRRAIRKVACRRSDGKLEFCRPGSRLSQAQSIEQVLFTPDPAMIPYCDITEAMKREGQSQGVRLRELLFQYNGKVIRSASALADLVLNRDLEPRRVCEALDRWRDNLADRIMGGHVATTDTAGEPVAQTVNEVEDIEKDEDVHTPQSFHGQLVSGAQLAKYMGKTSRTLRRWDTLRMVPTGKKWIPGMKVSGNVILYELSANWPAIQSMIRRERNDKNDRQIAHELSALAAEKGGLSND